jgi:hypothetical protein
MRYEVPISVAMKSCMWYGAGSHVLMSDEALGGCMCDVAPSAFPSEKPEGKLKCFQTIYKITIILCKN